MMNRLENQYDGRIRNKFTRLQHIKPVLNRRDGLQNHCIINVLLIIYVSKPLCKNLALHRHVCVVFLPNPPIAILELSNCHVGDD